MQTVPDSNPYLVTPKWIINSLAIPAGIEEIGVEELFGEEFLKGTILLLTRNRLTAPTIHWNPEMGEDTIPFAIYLIGSRPVVPVVLDEFEDENGCRATLYKVNVILRSASFETVVMKVYFGRGSIDGYWL